MQSTSRLSVARSLSDNFAGRRGSLVVARNEGRAELVGLEAGQGPRMLEGLGDPADGRIRVSVRVLVDHHDLAVGRSGSMNQ